MLTYGKNHDRRSLMPGVWQTEFVPLCFSLEGKTETRELNDLLNGTK